MSGTGYTMVLAFAVNGPGLGEACDPSSTFIFALLQEGFCLWFLREVLFYLRLGSLISFKFRLQHGLGRSECPVLMDTTPFKYNLNDCVS